MHLNVVLIVLHSVLAKIFMFQKVLRGNFIIK